ncbi:CoA transferase subunit A [Patulibacter medicamentivorans]|uniref:CoA transferase subunit A n=1 Tax=Patulibacter medicamentivorans TaxID=1097667 RepID=UPI0006819C41|nr:CoA-transferase [Patulibacter medicamentivorans]
MSAAGTRTELVADARTALESVQDGATVGIGGILTNGRPMTLVRELARRGLRDLTVVAPVAALDVDLLIATGCVRRVVTSYVGCEGIAGVAPLFRSAAESGAIEVWELDEAHCGLALRAAAQRLPFLPWRGGVGTDLPIHNPRLVPFADPIGGESLLAIPALPLDLALIHGHRADRFGNVQFSGPTHMDPVMASAAARVVVQVEELVGNDVIRRDPAATHRWRTTSVVPARWGTHPYAATTIEADVEHLTAFAAAGKRAARGDRDGLEQYLDAHVRGPADHAQYLDHIGLRRILELNP